MKKTKLFFFFICLLFLSFSLAHGEEEQRGGILHFDFSHEQSRVVFLMSSTLHDFDGVAKEVEGFAQGDIDHIAETAKGSLKIKVKSMTTNHKKRDEYMMENMEEEKYPFVVFSLTSIKPFSVSLDKSKANLELTGNLEIHGVKKEIRFPVEASIDGGKIHITGQKELSLKEYKVKPTSFLFLRVYDKMTIKFDITGVKKYIVKTEGTTKGS